jgi:molybdopterin molybdotransferase
MLSVDQALQLILDHAQSLPSQAVDIAEALGLVLAENVTSDIDSPPHDKSVVDGYAVATATLAHSGPELSVLEEVTAGGLPTKPVVAATTTRIMTGAPLPAGADAVIMLEQISQAADGRIRLPNSAIRPGQNIMRRASSMARGTTVLPSGRVLRAIEVGLLAEVGRSKVQVIPRPSIAAVATGNELVAITQLPGPGQIRNSNGPHLRALIEQAGGED